MAKYACPDCLGDDQCICERCGNTREVDTPDPYAPERIYLLNHDDDGLPIQIEDEDINWCAERHGDCAAYIREDLHESALAAALARAEAGEKFKAYVHARLDAAGIPTHLDGPHSREGCRVGDRLDFLVAWKDRAERERNARQEALEVARTNEINSRNALAAALAERDEARSMLKAIVDVCDGGTWVTGSHWSIEQARRLLAPTASSTGTLRAGEPTPPAPIGEHP